MRDSYLVRRILKLVALGIIITILLISGAYALLLRTVFSDMRKNDLSPKAAALGELVRESIEADNGVSIGEKLASIGKESILGADVTVTAPDGSVLFTSITDTDSVPVEETFVSDEEHPHLRRFINEHIGLAQVSLPVNDRDGKLLAMVTLRENDVSRSSSIRSLFSVMIFSASIVLPLAMFISYLLARSLADPLRQMNKVALSMASGSFSVRADTSQGGEVGELARSLNFLARELSGTISDLTLERNRLRDMINGLAEGIVAIDINGNITHTNTALAHMFSTSRMLSDGSADAKRLALIPFPELWDDMDAMLSDGGSEKTRQLSEGGRSFLARVTPLNNESGSTAGAVCIIFDITQAERLEATRREYVSNVSHELRRPLTALRGLIEPMRDGLVRSEETRMRYYDVILRETMRLSRLVDDLMELSRLQSGTLSLECSNVDMTMLLGDIMEKYTAAAEEKGIGFSLSFDPETIPDTWSNADRVEEILVILLDNALKFTPEGGSITLSASPRGSMLDISVADTGIGISKEDLEHIFDRFYKADKAHSEVGSGLGLSIAKEMLIKMGGDLTAESEPGSGSVFRFSLPLAR